MIAGGIVSCMANIDFLIIVGFLCYLASVLHDLKQEIREIRDRLPKE
jgi:hypothetical protein